MERKAKIVATIGPASDSEAILSQLINAGLDVARLNFSHGTHEQHADRIARIRKVSRELDKPVTLLQDLQGPKLRVGDLPGEGIPLTVGQRVILTSLDEPLTAPDGLVIPLDVPNLAQSVTKGNRILLDDGNLELNVEAVKGKSVETSVVLGGLLKSHKGVNLPGAHLDIPSFTGKDREDLIFGLQSDLDVVAISFVTTAADVMVVKQAIQTLSSDSRKAHTPVIAKLERPEAVDNLDEIMNCADGVMVARGDLGVETSVSVVPIIQKRIIDCANRYGKPVITATQMLESMIHNPRPTRAESTDVANAVFDGTDAVMLSGETASGSYPVEAVSVMSSIILEAERNFGKWGHCAEFSEENDEDAVSLTRAAREMAHDRNVACIAVFTRTGRTALLMSKARPRVPILAFTPDIQTFQLLSLYWGVTPFLVPSASTVESMLSYVETALISHTHLKKGEQVIIVSGYPVGSFRKANLALLHTLGDGIG
jgi:pyruvate kinase